MLTVQELMSVGSERKAAPKVPLILSTNLCSHEAGSNKGAGDALQEHYECSHWKSIVCE